MQTVATQIVLRRGVRLGPITDLSRVGFNTGSKRVDSGAIRGHIPRDDVSFDDEEGNDFRPCVSSGQQY
jgi:hypothetical protein